MEMAFAGHLICCLAFELDFVKLWTDSSAGNEAMSRIGPGKLKHIEAATLYIQEKVKNKEVSVHKVIGTEQRLRRPHEARYEGRHDAAF